MSPDVKRLQDRLDSLIDLWIRATPAERSQLILEKVRLEDALESVRRRDRLAS